MSINTEPKKGEEIVDGFTIKYHANGTTKWSKGRIVHGEPEGYWEWYRIDGTLKRSGNFQAGKPVGEWITYNQEGQPYKRTNRNT
jgi:antitoxin component YwqK of YwqJK toxin-antitoxin module